VMEMAVWSMEMAETVMETDGDGSEGTSPSWQGAGTETSVPQNSSVAAAELQDSFSKIADLFRVFHPEAFYRQKGSVRGGASWPHHGAAWPGARPRPPVLSPAPGPPPSHLWSSRSFGKNRRFGFFFVQFREYFLCNFSET
jgi:hypothetical protein